MDDEFYVKATDLKSASPRAGRVSKTLTIAGFSSAFLAALKFAAFAMTGSVVVLSSMLDSLSDAVVSVANGMIHKASRKSADREHPFGHGGIEVLSSLIQGAILFLFGVIVLGESLQRLMFRHVAERLDSSDLPVAIAVMAFAAVSGFALQKYLKTEQKKMEANGERSLSLSADSAHYESDALMNLVTGCGLAVVFFTDIPVFDSLFGAVGSFFLFRASWPVLKQSIREILHAEADPVLQKKVIDLILTADQRVIGVHRLRVRSLGPVLFVDFHMMLPHQLTLENAHEVGDKVAFAIRRSYPGADVIFHLDPDTEPVDDHRWIKRAPAAQ